MPGARDLSSLLNNARTTRALNAHYQRVLDRIIGELSRGLSRPGAGRAAELIAEINRITKSIDPRSKGFVRNWIRQNVPKAFVLGDRNTSRQLTRELRNIAAGDEFGTINRRFTGQNQTQMRAVTAAMEDVLGRAAQDLRSTVGTTIRRTQVTLRQSIRIRRATVGGIIRGATGQQVSDDIASILLRGKIKPDVRRRLTEEGFSGELFQDFERLARGEMIQVGRRKMNVRNYANLVARTQMREAHKVGTIARLQQNKVNHVRISRHPQAEIDECTPFAGKVFYIGSGVDPLGFPKLSSIPNGGPPFHPNCKHVLEPYVVAFKSPNAIADARTSSSKLFGAGVLGKTGGEVRDRVGNFSDSKLKDIAPEGFEDVR